MSMTTILKQARLLVPVLDNLTFTAIAKPHFFYPEFSFFLKFFAKKSGAVIPYIFLKLNRQNVNIAFTKTSVKGKKLKILRKTGHGSGDGQADGGFQAFRIGQALPGNIESRAMTDAGPDDG